MREVAFRWNARTERAAELVAADALTDTAIAREVGISARQLARWKKDPVFLERIDGLVQEVRAAVRRRGVAVLENRLAALDERHRLMRQLLRERATCPEMEGVAGGGTGLLVRRIKRVVKGCLTTVSARSAADLPEPDAGEDAEAERPALVLYEYCFDQALLHEMRATEQAAAQQLGEWLERQELTGAEGGPLHLAIEEMIRKVYGDNPDFPAPALTDGQQSLDSGQ